MRVTARAGEHCVEIRVSNDSPAMLRAAEKATRSLLAALPGIPEPAKPEPFGYAVGSDTQVVEPAYGTDTDTSGRLR